MEEEEEKKNEERTIEHGEREREKKNLRKDK